MKFGKIVYVLEWCNRFTIYVDKDLEITHSVSHSLIVGGGSATTTSLTLSLPYSTSSIVLYLTLLLEILL